MNVSRRLFIGTIASTIFGAKAVLADNNKTPFPLALPLPKGDGILFDKTKNIWKFNILRVNHPDQNNIVYPNSVVQNIVKTTVLPFNGGIGMNFEKQPYFQDAENYDDGDILIYSPPTYYNMSHTVEYFDVEKGYLCAYIKPQDYQDRINGIRLNRMLHHNLVPITMRTIGIGSGRKQGKYTIIQDDYELFGINAVSMERAVKL